eukprot:Pgem_evm1s9507
MGVSKRFASTNNIIPGRRRTKLCSHCKVSPCKCCELCLFVNNNNEFQTKIQPWVHNKEGQKVCEAHKFSSICGVCEKETSSHHCLNCNISCCISCRVQSTVGNNINVDICSRCEGDDEKSSSSESEKDDTVY